MKQDILHIAQVTAGISNQSSPYRLCKAFNCIGVDAQIVTLDSSVDSDYVTVIKRSVGYRILRKFDDWLIKIEKGLLYVIDCGIPFSYYHVGVNIIKEEKIKNADIIILHWICGAYISPSGIKRLIKLGKPIIMVCHDNWHFTGGCHVRLGCEKYKDACGKCPELHSKFYYDWSYRLLRKKKRCIRGNKIAIVSPSRWMDENVADSSLFHEFKHHIIPNTVDTELFYDKQEKNLRYQNEISDDAIVLAFGAMNAVSNPYKGYSELIGALKILEEKMREITIEAIVFGKADGEKRNTGIKMHYLGFLSEKQMVDVYNCADIYIVPSLEDSFNNTVIESMACKTPVVAFKTGGIVDIIDHKHNGYLADYGNIEDLAKGIEWVIKNNDNNCLGERGREKVLDKFSGNVVAPKYVDVCKMLINDR